MNTDLNNIASNVINARAPGRNAVLVSQHGPNYRDPGFLSQEFRQTFHSSPRLYITAESDEFDTETLARWRNTGFRVEYIPMGRGGKTYRRRLGLLFEQELEPCETFGIIAYGDAAGFCLEHFHILDNNPENKLGCLVGYYPDLIPDPRAPFPSTMDVLVHLAGDEVGVVKHSQLAGAEGRRRVVRKDLVVDEDGDHHGGDEMLPDTAYPCYKYDSEPGFAEQDLDVYDGGSAALAWDRSLAVVRKAFRL